MYNDSRNQEMEELYMKKLFCLLLVALLCLTSAAVAEDGVTRVLIGQDPSPAPIGWINEDSSVDGYDRAVMLLVDELLPEYEFEYEITDFSSLFSGVDSGRYAAIVDNLSWKEERAARYLYSNEFYMWNTTVIAYQKGRTDITCIEDLAGKSTVIAADGTFQQLFCENFNATHADAPINITYSDQNRLVTFQQIMEGNLDFSIQEMATMKSYEEDFGIELEYLIPPQEEQSQIQNPAGYWLFPQTEEGEKLRDAVDGAFRTLKADGTLEALAVKYFGFNIFEGIEE